MEIFYTLLIGHLLADFPLQIGWVYSLKMKSSLGLAFHVGIHIFVTWLLFENPLEWWPFFLGLGLIHFSLDWLKIKFPTQPEYPGFLLDQIAHILSLVFISRFSLGLQTLFPPQILLSALILAIFPALFTFTWVVISDLDPSNPFIIQVFTGIQRHFLKIAQITGLLFIIIGVFYIYIYI
jgi:hypothetical protein